MLELNLVRVTTDGATHYLAVTDDEYKANMSNASWNYAGSVFVSGETLNSLGEEKYDPLGMSIVVDESKFTRTPILEMDRVRYIVPDSMETQRIGDSITFWLMAALCLGSPLAFTFLLWYTRK